MSTDKIQFSWIYTKWYNMILWMFGIALIIGAIFVIFMGKEFSFFNVLLPSLFNTFFIWSGSMAIVMFVWNRFPWESSPLKHIVVETLLILSFLSVFVIGMNLFFCHQKGTTFVEGFKLNLVDILFTVLITFLIVTIH